MRRFTGLVAVLVVAVLLGAIILRRNVPESGSPGLANESRQLDLRDQEGSVSPPLEAEERVSQAAELKEDATTGQAPQSTVPASPDPVTEAEFRLVHLKQWLEEVESGKASIQSSSTRLLLCSAIAGILDAQGRGIVRKANEKYEMPRPDAGWRSFVYGGTLYSFEDWEFPEYEQYNNLSLALDRKDRPVPEDESRRILANIVDRGHQALVVMK